MQVNVYVFRKDDWRSVQQRLEFVTEDFCSKQTGIEQILGIDDLKELKDHLQVEKTDAGKPYFPNCKPIHFSISHSCEYWVCAVALTNIGVDIQEHVIGRNETREEATKRFRKMAHRFFHPLEARFVEYEGADSFYQFFTVWSAREGYVKNTGNGIDKEFSEHCVVSEDFQALSEVNACWQAMDRYFRKTIYKKEYSLCVCADEAFAWNVQEY